MMAIREGTIRTSLANVWLENGIIYIVFRAGVEQRLSDSKEVIAAVDRLRKGKPYITLVDFRNALPLSSESRKYYGQKEIVENVTASAFLLHSAIGELAINAYLLFQKPSYPIKLFRNKNLTLDWIGQYR